jgi:hypothetical protein
MPYLNPTVKQSAEPANRRTNRKPRTFLGYFLLTAFTSKCGAI